MAAPPQIISRALTFEFAPAVGETGAPSVVEVALLNLNSAANAQAGATFGGGLRTAEVELVEPGPNICAFSLIPSYSPGLSEPIKYRVMWRAGINGRTETFDFAMPDADLTWDELVAGPDNIIGGETYLQQTDLGVAGRVARLNLDGNVIDSRGTVVASSDDITALQSAITIESIQREQADNVLQQLLEGELFDQTDATLSTAEAYTDGKAATLANQVAGETSARTQAVTELTAELGTVSADLGAQISANTNNIDTITVALGDKADLDSGVVRLTEIPLGAITTAVAVADQAAMLALSNVYPGWLAVRPDGVWLLTGSDSSVLSHWKSITVVSSVNGHRGAVSLTAADVGAIAAGGSVDLSQVTGLASALLAKTDASVTATLATALTALQNDTTVVHTGGGGLIADAILPADIALVNNSNQVTNKSGTVVAAGGGGGGGMIDPTTTKGDLLTRSSGGLTRRAVGGDGTFLKASAADATGLVWAVLAESDVAGLSADLANRILSTDSRLTNARTPTAHATSHGSGGSDAITLATSQVTGLATLLTNNALTSSSNAVNRISSLEGRVTTIEGGGGGGGGGVSTTGVFYDSATTGSDVTDFTQVFLHSPFGIDSDGTITGTIGSWYYLHSGVRTQDVAYPYLTPNGHLKLVAWNEANAADPTYATTTALALKANASDLSSLSASVSALSASAATQSQITTLSGAGGLVGKANATDLATAQGNIATLQSQIPTLATITALDLKANASDMSTAQTNIAALQGTMPTKADLSAGKLLLTETPQNIPIAYISALSPYLGHLNATTGVFDAAFLGNVANIPALGMGSITGLATALAGKADLSGGFLATGQIPPQAISNLVKVANRAAMLALSTTVAHQGTFCQITGTSDAGTYILTTSDPTQFTNWTMLTSTSSGGITAINGFTGPSVTLSYTDVGALAANGMIPITQVTGLQAQLGTYATSTALTSGLAGKVSSSDVQTMLYNSSLVKRADYVATGALASLAGAQSVDGVIIPNGSTVLVTNQPSSVNNGLWVSAAGAWTRTADFATGSYLVKDTVVFVANLTGGGNGVANNFSIWQMSVASGFIDTAANNWTRLGFIAPPFVPVQGNGITVSGSTISANTVVGGGLTNGVSGLGIDTTQVLRKVTGTVPASNPATLTHNLNTFTPDVVLYDTGSNTKFLTGAQAISANAVSVEFANTPGSGQYKFMIWG